MAPTVLPAAGYGQALILAALAAALLGPVPAWLGRAQWPGRDPRSGLIAWLGVAVAAALATDASLLAAGLAAGGGQRGDTMLRPAMLAGIGLACWQVCVAAYCLLTLIARRRRHVELLELVGDWDAIQDCVVVDHDLPLAYSVAGRQPVVVVSRGCRQLDDDRQLQAVLVHERAHLRGHHDLLLEPFIAWRRAVPFLPAATIALDRATTLTEMLADSAAARATCPQAAVAAMHRISAGPAMSAPGWTPGSAALARARRLLHPPPPLPDAARVAVVITAPALVILPCLLLTW